MVEMDRNVAQLLTSILDDEFDVTWASTKLAALAMVREFPYDVLLVAQELSDGTGLSVVQESLALHPNLSTILLASAIGPELARAREEGKFLVLDKPIRPEAILDWVRHNAATTQLVRLLRKIAGQQEKT